MSLKIIASKPSEDELDRIFDAAATIVKIEDINLQARLEHAMFTFEIFADFGIYRDLHRHRMLTQERQPLTCNYGYYVPKEILETEMEEAIS